MAREGALILDTSAAAMILIVADEHRRIAPKEVKPLRRSGKSSSVGQPLLGGMGRMMA